MSGEIGMDLVDAITEWADRVDEELTENDIDAILRIQLAVDDSEWSGVDIGDLSAADLADLKATLHGVDAPDFTAWVIDETLAEFDATPLADPSREEPEGDASDADLDDDEDGDEPDEDNAAELDSGDEDSSDEDSSDDDPNDEVLDVDLDEDATELDAEDEESFESEDGDFSDQPDDDQADDDRAADDDQSPLGGIFASAAEEDLARNEQVGLDTLGAGAFASSLTAADDDQATEAGNDFFAELERNTTTSVTRAPVELKDGPDALGPTFLPPVQGSSAKRLVLSVLAIAALIAFVLAGAQLVNDVSGGEDGEDIDVVADAVETDEDSEGPEDAEADGAADETVTDSPENDRAVEPDEDESEGLLVQATPTPEPDRPPAESSAIVLTEDGQVWVTDLFVDTVGEPLLVYGDDPAAVDVAIVQAGLAIVDEDGAVQVFSLDDPSERVTIWRSGSLPDADQITDLGEQYAVLDSTGSISLFDKNRAATRSNVDTVWDAGGGTPPARSMDSYKDLLAFMVGNGEVRLIASSIEGNPISTIWDPTNQPRAFNLSISEHGLLLGVGAGAVARYQWFEAGPPLQAVWDPLDGSRLPAIGYAGLTDRTAVVLNSGTVASLEADGSENVLWDAEVSDLRATAVAASNTEALLILDGGTVLRVAADGSTEGRGSIWDVTDESVSPAQKVLVLGS